MHRISAIQEVIDTDSNKGKKDKNQKKKKTLFLSKGDNNPVDDRGLYPKGKVYLDESNVVGHVYA